MNIEIIHQLANRLDQASHEAALAACHGVYAAMDIVDTRYPQYHFSLTDVIARKVII